jgi:ubiquinone/menaquinone biosynthesis C-methylase UbiE
MKRRSLKQDKLARVYDTEILPIWAERFGRLLLAEAQIRSNAMVLNVACGTGYPALELLDKMDGGRIIALDSSSALLDVARSKAESLSGKRIFFRTEGNKERLSFDSDVYDLTFTNLGLGEIDSPPDVALAELARVTAPGGQVLVTLPLRGTWMEFLDIYREVLTKHDRHDTLQALTEYESTLPEPDVAIEWLEAAGLQDVDLVVEEFSLLFKSSREFFFAPVIEFGPLRDWKKLAGKGQEMQDIFWFIKESIDAYFGERAFSVTVVAGCLVGRMPAEDQKGESGSENKDGVGPDALAEGETAEPEPPRLGPKLHSKRMKRTPPVLDPPPLTAPAGFPDGVIATTQENPLHANVSDPDDPDSEVPLLTEDDVSIHELDDDDLEVIDDDEDTANNEKVTGIREEAELPEHLRKAIADAKDRLDE